MKNWIVNNFWIKVVSLVLAVIAWFYVNGELDKERRLSSREFYQSHSFKHSKNQPAAEKTKMNRGYIMEKE